MSFLVIQGIVLSILAVAALIGLAVSFYRNQTGFLGFVVGVLICAFVIIGSLGSIPAPKERGGEE